MNRIRNPVCFAHGHDYMPVQEPPEELKGQNPILVHECTRCGEMELL